MHEGLGVMMIYYTTESREAVRRAGRPGWRLSRNAENNRMPAEERKVAGQMACALRALAMTCRASSDILEMGGWWSFWLPSLNANGPLIAEVQQARLAFDEQWDQDWGVQLAKAHMEKIGDHTYWQTVGQRLKKMQALNGSVIRRRKDEKPWKIDVVPDYLIRMCLEHTDFPEILAYAANGGGWHNKTRGSVVKELVCKHSELWV